VLENLQQALCDRALGACGRYRLSSVNLDRGWVGPDMIGIDAGAAVLALDNLFTAGRKVARLCELLLTRGPFRFCSLNGGNT
jgi:hypothetical protein